MGVRLVGTIRVAGVSRQYGQGGNATMALRSADCELSPGDMVAMTGPSGSGKSTLLHLMAGLDEPTTGEITWPGIGSREALRPGPLAMVFQGPSLLPPLNVLENVALTRQLAGDSTETATQRAREALERLDIIELSDKLPEELSGGQAQRVAVARVLASSPSLILADEPTSQLDHENGYRTIDALIEAAEVTGAGLLVSTHDHAIADRFPIRWTVADGVLSTGESS